MSDRLSLPVRVDNDANLGALAEHVWGAGDGVDDMIYLKLATGIGAGLVLGGRLYVGVGGTAGEIGHTIIDEHGPVCRCANRGCLETLASGAATVDLLRPTLGDDLTLGRVVELTLEGHPAATRVVADAGRHIGRAVANLVNLLNPSRVVVGGEMAACGDVLLDPLRPGVPAPRDLQRRRRRRDPPRPARRSRAGTGRSGPRAPGRRDLLHARRPPRGGPGVSTHQLPPIPCPLHLEEERAFHA